MAEHLSGIDFSLSPPAKAQTEVYATQAQTKVYATIAGRTHAVLFTIYDLLLLGLTAMRGSVRGLSSMSARTSPMRYAPIF